MSDKAFDVGALPTRDETLAGTILGTGNSTPKVDVLQVVCDALLDVQSLPEDERVTAIIEAVEETLIEMDRSKSMAVINEIAKAGVMTKTDAKAFVNDCIAEGKQREKNRSEAEAKQRKIERKKAAQAARIGATIQVNDVQIVEIRDQLLDAVVAQNNIDPHYPCLYVRNGMLVRTKRNEKNIWSISEVSNADMKHVMGDVASWVTIQETEKDYKEISVLPPEAVASDFLSMPEWAGLPSLAEIVECPTFTVEGVLHDTPGYSAHSRMFYTGGAEVGDTTPTVERVAWAKSLLFDDLLEGFPFADDASRAHALAYIIEPFIRDMIDGPTPPKLIEAPMEGTGKSKLVMACTYPALGREVATMAFTNNDDELDKRITAKLLAGDTHAVLDNVNYELDSGVLANAWTQMLYEGRFLGKSLQMKLENRMIWAITANNIVLSAENARRCLWIHLDANVEKPRDRDGFKHPDLNGWVKANRDDLVTACITIVRAWVDAGMPAYTGKRRKGSYENWTRIMGGILQVVGVPGFLENEEELSRKAVTKTNLMSDFVMEWWGRYGSADVPSTDLFQIASHYDYEPSLHSDVDSNVDVKTGEANPFTQPAGTVRGLDLLGDLLTAHKERGRATQLGNLLKKHEDRIVNGYKIVKGKVQNGKQWWRLEDKRPGAAVDAVAESVPDDSEAQDKQQPLIGGNWSAEF